MANSDNGKPLGRRISVSESISSLGDGTPRSPEQGTPAPAARRATASPAEEISARTATFSTRSPRWKLEDLVVSDATMAAIRTAFARIEHHATLYGDWGLSELEPAGQRVVLNLYGLPGTGKTMCADAIASHFGRELLEVSYAEIESKYVGETPKNIVAAFKAASAVNAVLFFDEADSILGRRMTNVTQAADHGVNVSRAVMLKELDAFQGIVVFATNLAKNFDGAFVRRILTHIEFPPPDEPTRLRLWRKLIPSRLPGREALDFHRLAAASSGLSGGEIKNAIVLAASTAVARTGADRLVKVADLVTGIEHVQRARRDVGRYDFDGKTVMVEEVPLSAVPGLGGRLAGSGEPSA